MYLLCCAHEREKEGREKGQGWKMDFWNSTEGGCSAVGTTPMSWVHNWSDCVVLALLLCLFVCLCLCLLVCFAVLQVEMRERERERDICQKSTKMRNTPLRMMSSMMHGLPMYAVLAVSAYSFSHRRQPKYAA